MSQINKTVNFTILTFLGIALLWSCSVVLPGKNAFGCPVNGNAIVNKSSYDDVRPLQGLRFNSKDGKIFSCYSGEVIGVDTAGSHLIISVKDGNYVFLYSGLKSVFVFTGEKTKKGDAIGEAYDKQLLLLVSYKERLLTGGEILQRIHCNN
jgi:hypothetical protein